MTMRASRLAVASSLAALTAIATACSPSRDEQISRGAYLVKIVGCGGCHTPGALAGKPDARRFLGGADDAIIIAGLGTYSPPNLTPDKSTGLGAWSTAQIVKAMTTGVRPDGRVLSPVMPWTDLANLSKADADDIALYLQSLPAIRHAVAGPRAPQPCAFECVVPATSPKTERGGGAP